MYHCYKGKEVALLGFGRSGQAAADFLLAEGARLFVYAADEPEPTKRARYAADGVKFFIGPFPSCFPQEMLVRSPGIRPDLPPIQAALARGAVLTSEAELFLSHCGARVIAVTGSDGKTTTANLIVSLLREAGYTAYLGGNSGTPLLPMAKRIGSQELVVMELSSFQLMTLRHPFDVGVITNITPNHLNWHRDMAEYMAAKRQIAAHGAGILVYNGDCAATREATSGLSCPKVAFTVRQENMILSDDEKCDTVPVPGGFLLPGRHNRENLAAAYAAVRPWVTRAQLEAAAAGFHGVPHRLQYVDTVDGVRFYDSSIDTTPTRTVAALSALDTRSTVILGGRGKGVSFAPLRGILLEKAAAVCLYGEAAAEIAEAIGDLVPVHRFDAFETAFHAAASMTKEGGTVLLSPACTAFDQFRDFEHRGEVFCELVRRAKEEKTPS